MKIKDVIKENEQHEAYVACIVDYNRSGQAVVRRTKPVSKEHAEQIIADAKAKNKFTHPPYMTIYPASAGKLDGESIMDQFPDMAKDIAEDDSALEIKPLPGASEIDVGGKAIGTATDPATADMIKKASEQGTLKLGDPSQQPTSESSDIGGDATDEFIKDVAVKPHVDGSYEAEDVIAAPSTTQPTTPDTDGPGVGLDSAQGFRDAIRQGVGSSDPEIAAQVDKLVVAEPDGTVDVDQTIYNMMKVMDAEVIPQLVQFQKDMIVKFTELTKSPEWAQVSPADQASVLQSIKDMQASLPATEKAAADSHAQFQQNEPMMQQNIKDRKMNQQLKGTPAPAAPMSEADKALLEKMRMIAGLA